MGKASRSRKRHRVEGDEVAVVDTEREKGNKAPTLVMETDTTSPTEKVVDRLTSLPIHIAHIILSLLSVEDIAKLSLTSKKCEKLCYSDPYLDIIEYELNVPIGSAERTQFLNFLVNFMKSHRGSNLRKLRILWYTKGSKCDEVSFFMCLLNHSVECDVHELDLNLYLEDEVVFVMPLDVFCCESLRSLRIDLNDVVLEFPSPHGFLILNP